MKIHVLTSGEYSDYRLEAVCSTSEKAEDLKKFIRDANNVFEMEVDQLRLGEWDDDWLVTFDQDGTIVDIKCKMWEHSIYEEDGHLFVPVCHREFDPERVKKIACDKRAKYLAKKEDL